MALVFGYAELHEKAKRQTALDFLMAYNFAKRLKSLRVLTAYRCICKIWTKLKKVQDKSASPHLGTKQAMCY
jgi:hypothetical protein